MSTGLKWNPGSDSYLIFYICNSLSFVNLVIIYIPVSDGGMSPRWHNNNTRRANLDCHSMWCWWREIFPDRHFCLLTRKGLFLRWWNPWSLTICLCQLEYRGRFRSPVNFNNDYVMMKWGRSFTICWKEGKGSSTFYENFTWEILKSIAWLLLGTASGSCHEAGWDMQVLEES